jgi:hypothetical protein
MTQNRNRNRAPRAQAKASGYESLTPAQRAGYVAAIVGIVLFGLVSAIVFGPVM